MTVVLIRIMVSDRIGLRMKVMVMMVPVMITVM